MALTRLFILGLLVCAPLVSAAEIPSISAAEIITKLLDRAAQVKADTACYSYLKERITEDLDDDTEKPKRTTERLFRVGPLEGASYSKLLLKNGKPLVPADLKREADREKRFRERRAAERAGKADDEGGEIELNEKLASRFEFTLEGVESLGGRRTFVLSFAPKPGLAIKGIEQRVMSRIAGKLWVDEAEFEMAKVEFRLTEQVSIGWGIVGAVNKLNVSIERLRLRNGTWLTQRTKGLVAYRELFDNKAVKWREQMSEFARSVASN